MALLRMRIPAGWGLHRMGGQAGVAAKPGFALRARPLASRGFPRARRAPPRNHRSQTLPFFDPERKLGSSTPKAGFEYFAFLEG